MNTTPPIFVHSLHRSGSTYIFNAFRRAQKNGRPIYSCFQEPLHERAFVARDNPSLLCDDRHVFERRMLTLRHPKLDDDYFKELRDIHADWKGIIAQEIIYADYFGGLAIDKTAAYLQAIIGASKRQTVIQECRTPLRIAALKQRLGGTHIFLWRNPWDQWWSSKVDSYFGAVQQAILNAPGAPASIQLLRKHVEFASNSATDVHVQLAFYEARRQTPEASYLTAFMLLMLSLIESRCAADININIDCLSTDRSYREQIAEELTHKGVAPLDFSDCKMPHAPYCKSDEAFFVPLEERVLGWLNATVDQALVKWACNQRVQAAPKCSLDSMESDHWLEEIARRGELIRSTERREAIALEQLQQRLGQAKAVNSALKGQLATIRSTRTALKNKLAVIRGSTSWRITAPIRNVQRLAKRLVRSTRASPAATDLADARNNPGGDFAATAIQRIPPQEPS